MKLSIIVPIYNVGPYIERCVESILSNLKYNIDISVEIILVNDGSKDNSRSLIEKYQTENCVRIHDKKNGGLSSARNSGLDIATGDYILFIDGDDYIDDKLIMSCLPYMKKNIDIIMFDYFRDYGNSKKKADIFNNDVIYFQPDEINKLVDRLVGPAACELKSPHRMEDINPAWNKIYKSSILKTIRFVDTSVIGTEDLWFNINAFNEAGSICYINNGLYFYNKENEISLTKKYNDKLFDRWKVLYNYIDKFIGVVNRPIYNNLNNRIVINLIALTRNVCNSNLSSKEKKQELERILGDSLYANAFKTFEFTYLNIIWKWFFMQCKKKKSSNIMLFYTVAERVRRVL